MENPLANPEYRRLPDDAVGLLQEVSSPPRLVAHLVLVHDVAWTLMERISETFPAVHFDREAVLFGASTHDIGKTVCRNELVKSGKEHERRGMELLRGMGVAENRARFAFTHGNWKNAEPITMEDLLVALADKCWKGKRIDELEAMAADRLSRASSKPAGTCRAELDEILGSLACDAEARLAWRDRFDATGNVGTA